MGRRPVLFGTPLGGGLVSGLVRRPFFALIQTAHRSKALAKGALNEQRDNKMVDIN